MATTSPTFCTQCGNKLSDLERARGIACIRCDPASSMHAGLSPFLKVSGGFIIFLAVAFAFAGFWTVTLTLAIIGVVLIMMAGTAKSSRAKPRT